MTQVDDTSPERDAERLIAWVREAAFELENAHRTLDNLNVDRVNPETGNALTLAARIDAMETDQADLTWMSSAP